MLRNKVKVLMSKYPRIFSMFLKLYNLTLGRNKKRVASKNYLKIGTAFMFKTNITVKGKGNNVIIKDFSRLKNCKITIHGNNNNIIIDEKTNLNFTELYIEDDGSEIVIGKGTTICGVTYFSAIEGTKIHVGEDCLFSNDIHFRTGDSHSITDLNGKRINPSENIEVGNHVWIGSKVTCLKGSRIKENCIVGTGSLVTKSFSESNVILAGSPAKVVKNDVNWLGDRILINP